MYWGKIHTVAKLEISNTKYKETKDFYIKIHSNNNTQTMISMISTKIVGKRKFENKQDEKEYKPLQRYRNKNKDIWLEHMFHIISSKLKLKLPK